MKGIELTFQKFLKNICLISSSFTRSNRTFQLPGFNYKKLIKMIIRLCSLLIISIFVDNSVAFYPKVSVFNNPELAQKWSKASHTFDTIGWIQKEPYLKLLDQLIVKLESEKVVSSPCQQSLKDIKQGIVERKLWAYESRFYYVQRGNSV